MTWTVAPSLLTLRAQVNQAAPNRSKVADGTIGDLAHQAQSWSDHNPDTSGIVRALDLTHDPAHGLDAAALAAALVRSRDARIKYLIWNRRILRAYPKPGIPAWTWAPYTGDNPHTTHLHISVVADTRALYTRPWTLPPPKEDDMPTPADLLAAPLGKNPADGKSPVSLGYSIEIARNYAFRAFMETVALRKLLAAQLAPETLAATIRAALATGPAVDINETELARQIILQLGKETP